MHRLFAEGALLRYEAREKGSVSGKPEGSVCQNIADFLCALAACALSVFGGVRLHQYITYTPFTDDAIPAYISDEERTADSTAYMKEKFGTTLFDNSDDIATVGFLRQVLTEVYGLDSGYVYGINDGVPRESDDFFLPWGWDDGQNIARDVIGVARGEAVRPFPSCGLVGYKGRQRLLSRSAGRGGFRRKNRTCNRREPSGRHYGRRHGDNPRQYRQSIQRRGNRKLNSAKVFYRVDCRSTFFVFEFGKIEESMRH